MSDVPTHFWNETIRLLTKGIRVPRYFTLPYCSWRNGEVELGEEVFRVALAVLSELQQPPNHWPSIMTLIQSAINNTPSSLRCNQAPYLRDDLCQLQWTHFFEEISQHEFLWVSSNPKKTLSDQTLIEAIISLHSVVHAALINLFELVRHYSSKRKLSNFEETDYFWWPVMTFAGEKLCMWWRGPRHVAKAWST